MPPTPFWTGERLPRTGPTEIYLAYADLENPGEWVLVRVDYDKGVVVSGVRTKNSTFGSLLGKLDEAAQYAVGRQPTPPQPVVPWSLGSALIAWGKLAAPDLKAANLAGECKATH